MLLSEVLSRVDAESLHEAAKAAGKQKLLEEIIEACEIYGLKHYARADKNLKQSYYVQYVISQMTLQAEIQQAQKVVGEKKRESKAKSKSTAANLFWKPFFRD